MSSAKVTARPQAFTLIEMIGVVAILAILAAFLIPKVFTAMDNARVNNAAMSYNTAKTAVADHYAKFGSFAVGGAQPQPAPLSPAQLASFDQVLVAEGFLDKPFSPTMGSGALGPLGTHILVFDCSQLTATSVVTAGAFSGFNLAGNATNLNTMIGSYCVEAAIQNATAADAKELNDVIEGRNWGAPVNSADLAGRIKYDTASNGVTTIYVYLGHY